MKLIKLNFADNDYIYIRVVDVISVRLKVATIVIKTVYSSYTISSTNNNLDDIIKLIEQND